MRRLLRRLFLGFQRAFFESFFYIGVFEVVFDAVGCVDEIAFSFGVEDSFFFIGCFSPFFFEGVCSVFLFNRGSFVDECWGDFVFFCKEVDEFHVES